MLKINDNLKIKIDNAETMTLFFPIPTKRVIRTLYGIKRIKHKRGVRK